MNQMTNCERPIIGWREWISLPQLGVPGVKAKIDTGARSSCLHTHEYEIFEHDGEQWVRFHFHPLSGNARVELSCEARVIKFQEVKDSGGHTENRPFIRTMARVGSIEWEIDLNLSNREQMKFRMLLGREALNPFLVQPTESYLLGEHLRGKYDRFSEV